MPIAGLLAILFASKALRRTMSESNQPGLASGQKVGHGRYTLIRKLGEGGMGVVWLAQDDHLREEVALKFLTAQVQADQEALEGLRRETARAHRLTHPNIIRIHDFHSFAGEMAFISMEYVPGKTLAEMRHDQPGEVFAWATMAPLLDQLCEALAYAHQEGVIHRDLKPANMMVDAKGRLKLADFGIAAILSETVNRVSVQNSRSGTLVYMSPQQMTGETPQLADDIYAFGASLYHLLTGKPPFYQGDVQYQVRHIPPPLLGERLAEFNLENQVPEQAAAAISACLAKSPQERPPSMEAIRQQLRQADGENFPRAETKLPAANPQAHRGRLLWIAGILAALLVLGVGILYLDDGQKDSLPTIPDRASIPTGTERWTNSLGMVFVPIPNVKGMFCIWECRVCDYKPFLDATSRSSPAARGWTQRYSSPAVNVSWNDATAFCAWLTQREVKSGWLTSKQSYRLPTDAEWSIAVGLLPETGASPRDKSGGVRNLYPWGTRWPPPKGMAGNYAPKLKVDKFDTTTPVGFFPPNAYGLYDMGGNVAEWCADWYDPSQKERVIRGAGWNTMQNFMLLSSFRHHASPKELNNTTGFRIVLSN